MCGSAAYSTGEIYHTQTEPEEMFSFDKMNKPAI